MLNKLQLQNLKGLHWLVILTSLTLTLIAWRVSSLQADANVQVRFEREADQAVDAVLSRMKKYEDILWGGAATLKSHSAGFDRSEFKRFSKSLKLSERYSGVNGIGVIYKVDRDKKDLFISKVRAEKADFSIFPEHSESRLFPITFIEPEEINKEAIGLDMAHEKNRFAAVKKAEASGEAQITGPIVLVQDDEKTPGVLFYVPFFDNEKNIEGLVYAPFIFKKLMNGVLGNINKRVDVMIEDDDEGQELYKDRLESKVSEVSFLGPELKLNKVVEVYGRKWRFKVVPNSLFMQSSQNNQPLVILCAGVAIDVLLFLLFMALSRSRERAVVLAAKIHKKAEDQKIKAVSAANLASLGEMAGGIAHEINNPLAILSGNTTRLRRICKTEAFDRAELLETCDRMDSTIMRISKIINSMRVLSRNGSEDPFVKISVKQLISDVVIVCQEKFRHGNVDFKVSETSEDLQVLCRPVEISQVLINLLNNAYDAVFEKEGAFIQLDVKIVEGKVQIKIVDSGPGVSKEVVEKIMDPFFTTKEVGKGTGLGLSISKKIIENHNGLLFLDPTSKTTTFVIELDAA